MHYAHTDALVGLGLSKNEAKIYETLLRAQEASAGAVATRAHIHRRNVYDAMKRLVEKGLAYEVAGAGTSYRPVHPQKLSELVNQKVHALGAILPDLEKMHLDISDGEEVRIYKGLEGWKNYLRELVEVGDDMYAIGAKGAWVDVPHSPFMHALASLKRKRATMHMLYEHEALIAEDDVFRAYGDNYRFLPPGYATPAVVVAFGDRVAIFSTPLGKINEDSSFTVIKNQHIANAFRIWFKLLWSISSRKRKRPHRTTR